MDKECYPQCSSRGFSLAELAVVVLIVAVISAFFLWRFVSPDKNPAGTRVPLTIITAEGVAWKPPKPAGDYALIAVLRGDPAVPGSPFVIRAKSIRNCEFPPHGNHADEQITVLQGEATIGLEYPGNRYESSRLPAGSYCMIPGITKHYIALETESVLQIEGLGPAQYICAEPRTPRPGETGGGR
jgi:prepilin-type N-terminal cleavage/methylation domain-containing protein